MLLLKYQTILERSRKIPPKKTLTFDRAVSSILSPIVDMATVTDVYNVTTTQATAWDWTQLTALFTYLSWIKMFNSAVTTYFRIRSHITDIYTHTDILFTLEPSRQCVTVCLSSKLLPISKCTSGYKSASFSATLSVWMRASLHTKCKDRVRLDSIVHVHLRHHYSIIKNNSINSFLRVHKHLLIYAIIQSVNNVKAT